MQTPWQPCKGCLQITFRLPSLSTCYSFVLVFFIWSYIDAKKHGIKNIRVIWILTLLFGIAGAFPLGSNYTLVVNKLAIISVIIGQKYRAIFPNFYSLTLFLVLVVSTLKIILLYWLCVKKRGTGGKQVHPVIDYTLPWGQFLVIDLPK